MPVATLVPLGAVLKDARRVVMLRDLLLAVIRSPDELDAFKRNKDAFLSKWDLSIEERQAVNEGDIYALRRLLYAHSLADMKSGSQQPYLASDYTVSTSCDTPHCPINMSGSFDVSFWSIREPDYSRNSEGLTVVGTGIRAGLQTTPEALICIKNADKVLYLVADLVSQTWIQSLNPTAESMQDLYTEGRYRLDIYDDIVRKILSELRRHKNLCVVFYGHPGSFVYPAHEAIRLARREGFKARMLPGISADANLLADLGVDPGVAGIQSYEATNFLLNKYQFDASAGLILWQVGICGYAYWDSQYHVHTKGLEVLVEYLERSYGSGHEVVLYEASEFAVASPKVIRIPLSKLADTNISGVATLYVPPKSPPSIDMEMANRLGVDTRRRSTG
jgi:hypothetical protein